MTQSCPSCGSQKSHSKGSSRGYQRRICSECGSNFQVRPIMEQLRDTKPSRMDEPIYVITSAVSETRVHKGFWAALQSYAAIRKAKVIVVPIRYKNPTYRGEPTEDTWFDDVVEPYLTRGQIALSNHLTLHAHIAISPTAERPLRGLTTFGGVGGHDSSIFAHPKIALESVATKPGKHAKLALTTGACTYDSYSDSKTGAKAEYHHMFAAVVVERENDRFHVRHLIANKSDGSFYDLDKKYCADGSIEQVFARVFTAGDLHAVRANKETLEATFFAPDSIVQTTRPANIILHDVLDFESASHHNNFFKRFKLHLANRDNVLEEIRRTCELIDRIANAAPWAEIHIVDSNHDRHFERWLATPTNGCDPTNALMFYRTMTAWLEALTQKEMFSPLRYWADKMLSERKRVHFLTANDSLTFDRVEYAQHGDVGPNGVKGSRQAFVSVGTKMTTGHVHAPVIMDGLYQVGTTSELDMEYNKGFSSWLHSHCLHYSNGKRTLVQVIDGFWRRSEETRKRGSK